MNKSNFKAYKVSVLFSVMMSVAGGSIAQESAYSDLDACTKGEQFKLTAKGAITGALVGLGGSLFAGKKDNAAQAAVLGAVAGGAVGFATAYYTAIETCQKMNPGWVTESKINRDPNKAYAQVAKENSYKAKDGIKLLAKNMDVPDSVKAGSALSVVSTFDVMTPDGAEASAAIDRKLYVIEEGKETLVYPKETIPTPRKVEAGRNIDSGNIPIAGGAKAGTVYRVEFSVAPTDGAPSTISKNVTVS